MKTKICLALLIAFIGLSTSCKKHNHSDPGPVKTNPDTVKTNPDTVKTNPDSIKTKKKYLTQLILADTTGTVFRTITYSYDSKKRPVSEKIDDESSESDYFYNDNGDLYMMNVLTKNVLSSSSTFTYVDGKLSAVVRKSYENGVESKVNNFSYDYNGKITTELEAGFFPNFYTYDDNNNIIFFRLDDGYQDTQYTFDEKKNPYTNMPQDFKNPYIGGRETCSTNNIVKSVIIGGGVTTNYTYTYDSDGYPKTGISLQNFDFPSDFRYTYVYTEL